MKVIIAGGRDITIQELVDETVAEFQATIGEITEVVCGGATGVDTLGKRWAESRRIPVKTFPAEWNKHGAAAGPIRNREMAKYADALILVWDGKSRGSASMKREAQRHLPGLKIICERVLP